MNTKTITPALVATFLALSLATPTYAQYQYGVVSANATTPRVASRSAGKTDQHLSTLITRGDSETGKRVSSLNTIIATIQGIKRLTDAQKSTLIASAQSVLGNLQTHQTKLDGDTDATAAKTDVLSIFNNYRVYLLVLPQTRILAASDRIQDVVVNMQALATKLSARIGAVPSGTDTTAMKASLSDMQAKTADAQTQAQNAMNGVVNLTPDGGDKTKLASNNAAVKAAQADIKTALSDLKTAYTDAKSIVTGLKATK